MLFSPFLAAIAAAQATASLGPACKAGDLAAVQKIVKAGGADPAFDVNAGIFNPWGHPGGTWTALYVASAHGHAQIASYLVAEAGADPHKGCTKTGLTPLHTSCAHGSPHVVRALLAVGADKNRKAGDGSTPAMWALSGGVAESLRALTEGTAPLDVNAVATGGKHAGATALDIALDMVNQGVVGTVPWLTQQEMVEILRGLGAKRSRDLKSEL